MTENSPLADDAPVVRAIGSETSMEDEVQLVSCKEGTNESKVETLNLRGGKTSRRCGTSSRWALASQSLHLHLRKDALTLSHSHL